MPRSRNSSAAFKAEHGGWPLFHGGDLDLSCSVKAYFALKAVGDSPDAAHMVRARQAILAAGGAAQANVFTRIQLALFGELPWTAVPVMPVEIMHLPRWFPFHLTQGLLLVAHGDRAAAGADGEEAARAQSARASRVHELFVAGHAGEAAARQRLDLGDGLQPRSTMCCARSSR